jgi:glyoxylase-like metal-dependent hydrolase (beta-lactamase superfamily II)
MVVGIGEWFGDGTSGERLEPESAHSKRAVAGGFRARGRLRRRKDTSWSATAGRGRFRDCAAVKRPWIGRVKLHVLPAGPIQTNAYLLTAPERGEAVLIDAPGGVWEKVQPVLAKEGCALKELWITHGHWDHTQGGAAVVRATGAKVKAHAEDRMLIETPEIMERFMGERMNLEAIHVDTWVVQGDRFEALGTPVEVRHVPGHCPGNVLFYLRVWRSVFVGDALFAGSVGRTDLPGGDFETLERSIREQIYTLPEETTVYPGHGPKTTVAQERAGNPYVSG